jgi:hypothetical protein
MYPYLAQQLKKKITSVDLKDLGKKLQIENDSISNYGFRKIFLKFQLILCSYRISINSTFFETY